MVPRKKEESLIFTYSIRMDDSDDCMEVKGARGRGWMVCCGRGLVAD